jgi:beta-fructofuranosidase
MVLDDGRAIMWGWVREGRSSQAAIKAGWNGTMSLPLELSLSAAGLLKLAPARELEQLRGKQLFNGQIQSASDQILPGVSGEALEISAQLEAGPGEAFGLIVRHSPDGREVTRIVVQDQQVFIDREHSSLDPDVKRNVYTTPVEYGETISLRVYLDHSILEVFVNDQSYLVSRIYPTLASSLGVGIFGNINAARLEIWELGSIWA